MSTNDQPRHRPKINWFAVGVLVAVGIALLVFSIVNDQVIGGVVAFAIAVGVAGALVFFSRRSDTVALLGDDIHEERNVHIHQRAALYTLNILAVVIVGAFVVDLARGGDGDPFAWLAAVAGVTYVVLLLVLNRRS